MAISTAVKIAVTARKPVSKIIKVIVALIIGFITLIVVIISSLLSVFTGSFSEESGWNGNAQETEVYQTVRAYYKEYVLGQWETMTNLAAEYELANLVYHTHDSSICGYHTHTDACYRQHKHGDSCYTDYTYCDKVGAAIAYQCGCIYRTSIYKCRKCDSTWKVVNRDAAACKKGHESNAGTQSHEHSHVLTCTESTDKFLICEKEEGYQCGKTTETIEYCKADITVEDYQYVSTAYILAYLSAVHKKDYLQQKHVEVDKSELFDIWNQIDTVAVDEGGTEDRPTYKIYNKVLPLEEIIALLFHKTSEQKEYENSVYLISQCVGAESFDFISHANEGLICSNSMSIPLYYQYSAPWGMKAYGGNGTISKNGCAPACIAMVFSYLKNSDIYPDDIVKYTGNQYYVNGQGSSWSIFSACAEHWGISCMQIGTSQKEIAEKLSKGCPVILSMGPGMFTSSGHFIVLTGIDVNGSVTVNDPNDNDKKNFRNKQFSLSQILNEAKGGWYFE